MTRLQRHTPDMILADRGFSLIEVLVALTVLSIAGVAFIRVAQSHIDRLDRLEVRMLADIVAQNKLVELRLAPSRIRSAPERVEMAGREWQVSVESRASSDHDLAELNIAVSEAGARRPATTLHAFVDTADPS